MNARDPLLPLQPDEAAAIGAFAAQTWDDEIVPALTDYIAIPAKSPMFDADWQKNGYIDRVVRDAAAWVEGKKIAGLTLEVVRLPGRTPVIFFEVPATKAGSTDTICLYGHLDKQPEFNGWRNDLGPWTPKYENGLLYGRGGADDGYAVYASITAIAALDRQGIPRPRCVGIIESCEESGSFDLPAYIDMLRPRLGKVALVVCLDSGAGNYDQLWLTTSLRGNVTGTLKVEILTEGVHSGDSSGLVPSSFRILRQVLDRLEDAKTGNLLPQAFHCQIPADRLEQARATAEILGDEVWKRFPWACGADGGPTLPTTTDPTQALLNRTWKPTLSVTGADGFPELRNAGNVLRPYTAFKLSLRLPPLVDGNRAAAELKALLEDNAPYNAKVTFAADGRVGAQGASGWNAPTLAGWLEER
jgi:acetylornithine deacetylase/succinyl-diaminopimelate desuccinylase-like protein